MCVSQGTTQLTGCVDINSKIGESGGISCTLWGGQKHRFPIYSFLETEMAHRNSLSGKTKQSN